MQGAPPQQPQLYSMTSPELWGAAQPQHAAQGGMGYGGGAPQLLHGGGGMAPLPSFEMGSSADAGQPQLVLPGKPLPASAPFFSQPHGGQGGMAGVGITGVPNSLTSLPGLPYSSTPSPPPGSGVPPSLYGGSPALAAQPGGGAGALPMGGHPSGGFPQLSDLSSQLSSGMGASLAPQLVPNAQLGGLQDAHGQGMPLPLPITTQGLVKLDPEEHGNPSSSHSAAMELPLRLPGSPVSEDDGEGDGSPTDCMGSGGLNKSRYRGVSYDRKKAKWRVQIKVAALGKSGVSVGYFDTEEAAARAYDRAAIGLLGRDNPNLQTNFDARDYTGEAIPPLTGKTREEVKTTLKSERIKQAPRRRFTSRQRTSRFMGVGSSNRKNQWQARILVHGKVTHLGYYETEEEAARVYDRVSLALHGDTAQTNFPPANYAPEEVAVYSGLDRENLQRALGVKPMDKSSRFRGVSKKKGKWEAKVMVNRRWAYRELFDSEEEAARAYDRALWRLKPKEAHSYVNFKDEVPPEVAHLLGEEGGNGGGGGGGGRHHGRARAAALASSDEEEAASEGSEGASDEDGSGGTPRAPAWTQQRTSRSGRRLRGPGAPAGAPHTSAAAAAAVARAASAPNLHSAAAVSPQQHMAAAMAAAAPPATLPLESGFVALPGGGLQLQFGVGGGLFGGPAGASTAGAALPPPAPAPLPLPLPLPAGASAQPLLVRVGSETHLIPSQQAAAQQRHAHGGGGPAQGQGQLASAPGSGSALGKRMNRIQSEPAFSLKEEGGLSDLMNDRDLFKAFEMGGEDVTTSGGGGGSDAMVDPLELDTHELLDFIRDMPDATPTLGGGGGGGGVSGGGATPRGGRGGAGMFKSRSMGNLMDLSVPFFDEEDEALAAMEYARPRKISKSMSMNQLSAAAPEPHQETPPHGDAHAGSAGRPPLPPSGGSGDSGKLGPLGQPIRRTNTFSSSLAVLEEELREGRGGDDHLVPAGFNSHHSSGDDLVGRLFAPAAPSAEDDAMLASMLS